MRTPRVPPVAVKDLEPVVVRALGVAVAIPVGDAETAARLRRQWSRALTTQAVDETIDVAGLADLDHDEHDYAVTIRVTMRALEATAGTRLNIHAGAAADAEGRALAIVGASGTGKTTAIRSLATRLGYLSDETVSVTEDLVVHPHPKPLSIIIDEAGAKASVSPDDAGLLTAPERTTLRRIVLLRRGHGTDGLVPITTPEAIVEIVPQTSSLVLLDAPLLRLSQTIDKCGGAYALHYDEVTNHLDELIDLLASPREEPDPAVHHPPIDLPEAASEQWSRSPWLDAVQYDDQLVVMVNDTAHLLAGLGTTLWLALAQPATMDELIAAAEAEHGAHPDAPELIEAALAKLDEGGLVAAPG